MTTAFHRRRPETTGRSCHSCWRSRSCCSMVVLAIATYATTSLSYGQVAEDRSDRLSAADAGMRYAIDQLKLRNAGCILDTQEAVLPGVDADFNNARATVVCERVTSGYEGIQAFAAVMTGVGVPSSHLVAVVSVGQQRQGSRRSRVHVPDRQRRVLARHPRSRSRTDLCSTTTRRARCRAGRSSRPRSPPSTRTSSYSIPS